MKIGIVLLCVVFFAILGLLIGYIFGVSITTEKQQVTFEKYLRFACLGNHSAVGYYGVHITKNWYGDDDFDSNLTKYCLLEVEREDNNKTGVAWIE